MEIILIVAEEPKHDNKSNFKEGEIQSEDLFHIYYLLVKKPKNDNKEEESFKATLKGVTHSKDEDKESFCSGQFRRSVGPQTGGSILQVMEDLVKVGQTIRFIVDTWNNMSISDTNAISKFMKKLRHLKLQTRLWVRDKKECATTKKSQLKEIAQKAKIKWSIEGDENSIFFHGILNKKRNQHAIHGILSEDGPFILDELIHWCHAKKKETMIFKVNFGKAYDSVRWDYLDDVLNNFGFSSNWRNWTHNCLNSSKGSILVNGSPTREFQFQKGLKQGYPLSSILFLLIMESLHLSFQNLVNEGLFKRVSASVLRMNLQKSKLIGISVEDEIVSRVASKMRCCTLTTPFLYLRIKVGGLMSHIKSWDEIEAKLHSRLSKWKMKTLSSGDALWSRFIRAVHGNRGGIETHLRVSYSLTWLSIVNEVNKMRNKGIDLLKYMKIQDGNGLNTKILEDVWMGNKNFKTSFPRIYALESDKNLIVAVKMAHNDVAFSLRHQPRDGVEMEQFRALSIVIEGVLLHDMVDRWKWTLEGLGEFTVASARKFIDNSRLIGSPKKTRWIKMVHIKVNILAWKDQFDLLLTRLNLSRRAFRVILSPLIRQMVVAVLTESSMNLCDDIIESIVTRRYLIQDMGLKLWICASGVLNVAVNVKPIKFDASVYRLILNCDDHSLYSVPFNKHEAVSTLTKHNFGLDHITTIQGCVNGLVLATAIDYTNKLQKRGKLLLLNPTTKDYVELPDQEEYKYGGVRGFGYDSVSDDYKVVVFSMWDKYWGNVFTYNLRTNTWKHVGDSPYGTRYLSLEGVFLNGALHWIIGTAYNLVITGNPYKVVIATFSLADEKFGEVPAPDSNMYGEVHILSDDHTNVVAVGEKLVIFNEVKGHIYLMNEYGVEKSWTNIVVNGFNDIPMVKPKMYFDDGKFLFLTHKLLWLYVVEKQTFRESVDISPMNIEYSFL
nr:hypothetical protein [Tanacetum cinerariifolium]